MPELKKFLKEGEAEQYENVEVNYVQGRKAVLTIFEDEEVVESITLSEYSNREEMHNLMAEKGFTKKVEEENGIPDVEIEDSDDSDDDSNDSKDEF